MTVKTKLFSLWIFLYVILLGLLCVLTGLVIYEYRFFVTQLDELTQLKQEYDNYLLLFKRSILDANRSEKEEALEGEKKKLNECSDDVFVMVNRDPAYLLARAQEFSRQHNLEAEVTQLYKKNTLVVSSGSASKNRKQRNTGKRKNVRVTSPRESSKDIEEFRRELSLRWPIEKKLFWLSYGFGPRRHPSGRWEFHSGIDLAAPLGTPVYAAADGMVIEAHFAGGYGNTVVIAHDKKYRTRYAHLSKILVRVGDEIQQGVILGKVGATGNVRGKNGSHLHFEVSIYSKRVNPFYFLP